MYFPLVQAEPILLDDQSFRRMYRVLKAAERMSSPVTWTERPGPNGTVEIHASDDSVTAQVNTASPAFEKLRRGSESRSQSKATFLMCLTAVCIHLGATSWAALGAAGELVVRLTDLPEEYKVRGANGILELM